MEPADALLMLVVAGLAAGVVLRDVAAFERPARERAPRRARPARQRRAARPARDARSGAPDVPGTAAPVDVVEPVGLAAPVPAVVPAPTAASALAVAPLTMGEADDTWLGQIARHTEHDERSAGRRVVSALLLLTLTLLAAGVVGALIYRGLGRLG
ncbi:MAG TPA: hypothetical protein VGX28_01480 [Frankiaceae bacterium]|nr:hypothetical protein [Frankiaceae bacterium]